MTRCLELDRVTPTHRPQGPSAGTQRWRELLFVHWSYEPEVLRRLVPTSFELDLWDGRAWVGMVPFRMRATRPSWIPRRAGIDFLELNLRTYVFRNGEPGVFFFSLEAASWLAVHVARLTWGLPYFHADMAVERTDDCVTYRSRRLDDARHPSLDVTYEIGSELGPSKPDTLEYFLLERYLLFAQKRGRPVKGQVHHAPYPVRKAKLISLREDLQATAGLVSEGRLETVHYSDGVDVEVFGPLPTPDAPRPQTRRQ